MSDSGRPSYCGQIGRYEVLGRLADGGMAEILLGRLVGPRGFEQPVVIKRMLPALKRNPEFIDMFVDEATIAAAVRHPNVVGVHELGREDDELFLVLEYLEGESVGGLARRLWSRGADLDRRLAAHIIADACAGLHAAHELTDQNGNRRDVVHRDVSPQNVFVTYRGTVKLLDFGIAKAAKRHTKTEAGQVKGKFGYMSPEQCFGKPLDRRSDIFSLGILLYELSTSRRLFRRESQLETLKAITEQPVVPPTQVVSGYPAALESICLRALQRRREDRFATAADMRRELLTFIHSSGEGGLPEEALAQLMQRSFPDRIEAKREMIRRVVSGSGIGPIPSAEVDETVEIPIVLDEGTMPKTRSAFSAASEPIAVRRTGVWAGVAAATLAGAGLAFVILRDRLPASVEAPPADVAATDSATAVPSPPSAPTAEPVAEVALHVETSPAGAAIRVAGTPRGETPAEVRVRRGAEPVMVEVSRDGFEPWSQAVVPDINQRIVVPLRPKPVPRGPVPRPAAKPAPATQPGYEKL